MINATAPYRRDSHAPIRVPVVMSRVEVSVDGEGLLSVLLDREPYAADGALTRDDLQRVLNDIAADLGTPIRVEVSETDGSTFTDIVTPGKPKLRVVEEEAERKTPSPAEVSGIGFHPGEEVAVAVVVARQVASADGSARLRLPPTLLEAHPGLVVLMGQDSGSVVVSGGAA